MLGLAASSRCLVPRQPHSQPLPWKPCFFSNSILTFSLCRVSCSLTVHAMRNTGKSGGEYVDQPILFGILLTLSYSRNPNWRVKKTHWKRRSQRPESCNWTLFSMWNPKKVNGAAPRCKHPSTWI